MSKLDIVIPSDEEAITFSTFTFHIFRSWCGFMAGGIIGAGFAVYQLFGSIPTLLFGLVGVIAIFVACYHLWREERKDKLSKIQAKEITESNLTNEIKALNKTLTTHIKANTKLDLNNEALLKALDATTKIETELRNKLKDLKDNKRPKLVGFFREIRLSDWFAPDETGFYMVNPDEILGCWVWLRIGFVNESQTPTTIHGFSLAVKTDKGKEFFCKYPISPDKEQWGWTTHFDENKIYHGMVRHKEIELARYIDDTSKISKTGERIEGFITFNVENMIMSEFEDMEFILTITDAFGVEHPILGWGEKPRREEEFSKWLQILNKKKDVE